jgi:hypothetical protein
MQTPDLNYSFIYAACGQSFLRLVNHAERVILRELKGFLCSILAQCDLCYRFVTPSHARQRHYPDIFLCHPHYITNLT